MHNKTHQNFQSTQLLRTFFASPFTFAIGICSSVAVVLNLIFPLIEEGFPVPDLISASFGTAFFILYFKATSNNPCPSFNIPLNIIMITSMVEAVIVAIPVALLVVAFFIGVFFIIFLPVVLAYWFIIACIIFICSFFMLHYVGLFFTAKSIKNTLKTGVLKRKITVFTSVAGIVFFSLFVIGILISFFSLDSNSLDSLPSLDEAFSSMVNFTPATTNNLTIANLSKSDLAKSGILSSFSLLASVTNYLLISIYFFKYSLYIKKASAHYVPVVSQPPYAQQIYTQQNKFNAPVVSPAVNYDNAIQTNEKTCPNCGIKNDSFGKFCSMCGFKLTDNQ